MRGKIFTLISTLILASIAYMVSGLNSNIVSAQAPTAEVMLSIPSIDVQAPVVTIGLRQFEDGSTTWDTSALNMNIGHLQGLPWFGQGGNVVLGGHSELARGEADVFYDLDKVQIGDEIMVQDGDESLRYVVSEISMVSRMDLSILRSSDREILTIMTCELDSFAEGGIYEERLVVIAERVA